MTKVREIMTESPRVVDVDDTIVDIARVLNSEDIGGVIVCDHDHHLKGMVTDRDITTQVVAAGLDPASTRAVDLLNGAGMVTIGADDDLKMAVTAMQEHAVRRLPVVDGTELVGIISQADLAKHAPESLVGAMVDEISGAPGNTGHA